MDAAPQPTDQTQPPRPQSLANDTTSALVASGRPSDDVDMSTAAAMPALSDFAAIEVDPASVRATMDDLLQAIVKNNSAHLFDDALAPG